MSLDSTERLNKSITSFDTFNDAMSKSKKNAQTKAMKHLLSILEKLLELIRKVSDRTYAKIAEEKFIESKARTAVKDKETMYDLIIAFDDHVDHASRIMKSPPSVSRKKKIKEALKQAEDVLFSMAKHQGKMKKDEDRFQATLPVDSETSSTKNRAANDNFRTIGEKEKKMDGKQYIDDLKAVTEEFVYYSLKFDKLDRYEEAEIGLSLDEQEAFRRLQRNTFARFEDDCAHFVVHENNEETTGVMVRYWNGSSLFTSHDEKTIIAIDENGKKTTTKKEDGYTTVTNEEDGSYYFVIDDTRTYCNINNQKTDQGRKYH